MGSLIYHFLTFLSKAGGEIHICSIVQDTSLVSRISCFTSVEIHTFINIYVFIKNFNNNSKKLIQIKFREREDNGKNKMQERRKREYNKEIYKEMTSSFHHKYKQS